MSDFFNNVKPGARVHYMTPQGQTRSGTVVMNRGTHLVLNRGGGQPQVVTKDNYIKHSEGGKVKGALLSKVAQSMKEAAYRDNPNTQFFVHKLKQGALVMNDRGDVHDHYETHDEAQKVADKLNNDYGVKRWNKKRDAKEANEETQLDELKTSTLKSYGRKALKDLPKQVKRSKTAWKKHVSDADVADPDAAWDQEIDAQRKLKARKAGIKRLAGQLKARGETSVNEETLEAQKTALAYETTKKKKKKRKQVVKPGAKHASSARPTNEESTADIMARVKKGDERSKALLAKVKKDRMRRKYEVHGGSSKYSASLSRGTGRPLGTLGIGEAKEDLPFEPDDPKKIPGVVKGKKPKGYSIARHLARMARDKAEKQKKMYAKEGYDARETEHSGAKKGKGAYYGRKKDAKKESNKARREADKKQCCDEARGVVSGIGIHDDPKRQARVKDVAKRKIIDKIRKAEKDEKTKHGGWTGVHEERIDEIGPFNISKHPVGKKVLKVMDKVVDKLADRSDRRYQKKQDKIAKERFGKSWTEAGMRAPRKIDPTRQRYPDGSGPTNESALYDRLDEVSKEKISLYIRKAARNAAASAENAGVAWGRTAIATRDLDKANDAERKYVHKTRRRMKNIDRAVGKLAGDPLAVRVPATEETELSEVSKDLLARYISRSSRQAADQQYSAGHAFGSTMQAHKSAAKLQHGRPMKFAGKRRELAYDAADKAEAPHMEKSRKRLKGIQKALDKMRGDDRYAFVPATNEGRESEYSANLALAQTARKKPGHYLVRNGQHISGPHDPQGALNKYKDMSDNTGVKIVHIKEANKLQADVKKAGAAIKKAMKNAKKKTANVDPELETPSQQTSQPILQGPENVGAEQSI